MCNAQSFGADRFSKVFFDSNFAAALNAWRAASRNFDFGRRRNANGPIGCSARLERGETSSIAHELLRVAIGLPSKRSGAEFFLGRHDTVFLESNEKLEPAREVITGNDDLVHFIRAIRNAGASRMPIPGGKRHIVAVSKAAVHLNGIVEHVAE